MQNGSIEMLARQLRDPDPVVWRAACRALGLGSLRDPSLDGILQGLLVSRLPEMRLRGAVALRALAPHRPEEVLAFASRALEETDEPPDPAWLDAVFEALPAGRGSEVVLEDALCDVRDTVRAAATWSLRERPALLRRHATELAADSSELVRATLVATLSSEVRGDEVEQALEMLAVAPEALLRELVAADLPREQPVAEPILARLRLDADEGVRAAARASTSAGPHGRRYAEQAPDGDESAPAWQELQGLEARLDREPHRTIDILRPSLVAADPGSLLGRLASLARNPSVASCCLALERLWSDVTGGERALLCEVAALLSESVGERGGPLHELVLAGIEATAACSSRDIGEWGRCRDERSSAGNLALLVSVAREGAGDLSALLSAVERARATVESRVEPPESRVLEFVLRRWSDLLDAELEDSTREIEL